MKSAKRLATKSSWQLLYLYNRYKEETGIEEVNLDDVYEWAAAQGLYVEPPTSPSARFKRDLSRVLRSQHHTDPQNREVRTNLPVIKKSGPKAVVLWADQRTARPQHVHLHLQQHRMGILASCKRHKTIRDSYNDNNLFNTQIPLFDYNFNPDIEESGFPTDYPNEKPKE
jgi:hypothetical protein